MYQIKRGTTVIWEGKASGKQHKVIMQEDRVVININKATPINFKLGDTIDVYGQTYKLNRYESVSRINTSVGYTYSVEFEALYYDLGKWEFYSLDASNQIKESEVFIMSDASVILDLIVRNANRSSSGWAVGTVDATEVMQYAYSNSKLLTVLQDVADKNNLEFWVDGKTINLTKRQPNTGLSFEHGKGKGLYQVSRDQASERIINTLRVFGGSRNLPNDYPSRKLLPTGGNPFINDPISGDVVEETIEFANVYPRLVANISSVPTSSGFNVIRSTAIDFNINTHLLNNGTPAKITFTTGQLAGFTFGISAFDNTTKQITFNRITDDPAYPSGVPNSVMKAAVGDKFVLLDISMPLSYVTAAENQLKTLAEQYLADYSVPQYNWTVSPTPLYILENDIEFPLGGVVNLKDAGLNVDIDIRISGYVRDLENEHLYELSLSNIIGINELVRQQNTVDQFANLSSKGISIDGSSTLDDLAKVTARGKVTPFDITVRGTRNTHFTTVPAAAPVADDIEANDIYVWSNEAAPSGETPDPTGSFTISGAADASVAGRTNGQILSWNASLGKWIARDEQAISGYATQSWVLAQGFLQTESDTLDSVLARNPASTKIAFLGGLNINGASNAYREIFWSTNGVIRWDIYTDPSPETGNNAGSNLALARYSDSGDFLGSVFYVTRSTGVVTFGSTIEASGFNSDNWGSAYTHSQTTGNPHGTTFAQLNSKPTTLAGFGITDVYTKTESDTRYLDTLQSVTERGKVTTLDIKVRGTRNTHFATLPTDAPISSDIVSTETYIWSNETAPSGTAPNPSGSFTISGAADASVAGRTNGQILSWNANLGKWVSRDEQSVAGYATQSWVLAQPFGSITTGQINNWDAAFTNSHTHANKDVIDGITSGLITNWNTAFTHSQITNGNPHGTTFAQLLDKPTTVAGFGITDVYTKTESDTRYLDTLDSVLARGSSSLRGAYFGQVSINGPSGSYRDLTWRTNGNLRWDLFTDSSPETGGNTGSNLFLGRFDDAGSYLGSVFAVNRTNGDFTFSNMVYASGYSSDNWKAAYIHSQTSGNPHGTTFAQLNSIPTTLAGYGITDAVSQNQMTEMRIGGENRYSNLNTVFDNYNVSGFAKNTTLTPNGFQVTGSPSDNYSRALNVIDSNGEWTVSGYVRGSQNTTIQFTVDICDQGYTSIYTTNDNTWKYFEVTVNVTNYALNPSIYNFVDFENLSHAYFFFKDIKIVKARKSGGYTPNIDDSFGLKHYSLNNSISYDNSGWQGLGVGTKVNFRTPFSALEVFSEIGASSFYIRSGSNSSWGASARMWTNLDFDISTEPDPYSVARRDSSGYLHAEFIRTPLAAALPRSENTITSLYGNDSGGVGYHYAWTYQAVNQFLKMPEEGDTLDSVLARGATTSKTATLGSVVANTVKPTQNLIIPTAPPVSPESNLTYIYTSENI